MLERPRALDTGLCAGRVLHATRILDPWDARSLAWGRAPRLDDARLPATTIDDARRIVRVDVAPLVRRWRLHSPDDQGLAILADRSSATGMAFAVADGSGAGEDAVPLPSVHSSGPPTFFSARASEGPDGPTPAGLPARPSPRALREALERVASHQIGDEYKAGRPRQTPGEGVGGRACFSSPERTFPRTRLSER